MNESTMPTRTFARNALDLRPLAPFETDAAAPTGIAAGLNGVLADVFSLYMKTKNFHWHVSGPHFRDYHVMFGEQAAQLHAMTDPLAERVRKTGSTTLRSIGHIARSQHMIDNDAEYVDPSDMLAELRDDNRKVADRLRVVHALCSAQRDIASASLIEGWLDETEQRIWFLYEAGKPADLDGR